LVQAVANLATAALGVALTGLRVRATPRDFGLSLRDLGSDVALGAAAFCMLAPPVLAMQGVLTKWFPSEHPLVVMLREKMTGPLFVVGVFVAVIVAPVVEEFVFRVLLQGWMERLGRPKQLPPRISPEYFLNPPPSMPATSMVTAELVSEGAANPYAVPQQDAVPAKENPIAEPPPRWPIFVSAVIFALMHAGNGPDPIPLFFLALGLGYLYRQTHRITPSMTVHFLLNAASMTLLWMELTFGGK
jgi:membrane protease YdiL (CAAX protease family)